MDVPASRHLSATEITGVRFSGAPRMIGGAVGNLVKPSILPEAVEAIAAQLSVAHRVHDVAMAHEVLQRAGIGRRRWRA
jgi:hypothetical protein